MMTIKELARELNVDVSVVRSQYRTATGKPETETVRSATELTTGEETAIRLAISEQVYQEEKVPVTEDEPAPRSGIGANKVNLPPNADEFVELAVAMAQGMASEMKFKSSVSGAVMQLLSDYEAGRQTAPENATRKELRMAGMEALPQHDKLRAAIAALYDARIEMEGSFADLKAFTALGTVTYVPDGMGLGQVNPTALLSNYFAEYTPTGAGYITPSALPEKSVLKLAGRN